MKLASCDWNPPEQITAAIPTTRNTPISDTLFACLLPNTHSSYSLHKPDLNCSAFI